MVMDRSKKLQATKTFELNSPEDTKNNGLYTMCYNTHFVCLKQDKIKFKDFSMEFLTSRPQTQNHHQSLCVCFHLKHLNENENAMIC